MKINRSFLMIALIGLLVIGLGFVVIACTTTTDDDDDDGCPTIPCTTNADCGGYLCANGCCTDYTPTDDDDTTGDDDDDDNDDDSGDDKWQNPPSSEYMDYYDALAYCSSLTHNGHSDWRLPTVGELRTLIQGCAGTVTGGPCGATDSCTSTSCFNDSCMGCDAGCYLDSSLDGPCECYWTSSTASGKKDVNEAWFVCFQLAQIYYGHKNTSLSWVRCIR